MKNLRNFALAAFALLGFAACQQEEFAPEIKNPTHSVTFVAGAPETKTTATIDGTTVNYAWTKADEKRFTVYENGTEAKESVGILETKKMTVMATFKGSTAPKNASYVAVVNKSNATQIMSAAAYDEEADILVSKAVSSFDGENGVLLQFKREVAIAKMTLKDLDPGEVVNHVTVSSTADIAGKYGVDGWASPAKSLEISSASYMGETDGYSIVANASGEAVVWFTCIPQTDATLTVQVQAADGDTYTKEFSKLITLTRGDVKAFGVAMTKDVVAAPEPAVLYCSDVTTSGYVTTATHVINESLPFEYLQISANQKNQPTGYGAGQVMQFKSSLGEIYNTESFGSPVKYVEVFAQSSNPFYVYYGDKKAPSENIISRPTTPNGSKTISIEDNKGNKNVEEEVNYYLLNLSSYNANYIRIVNGSLTNYFYKIVLRFDEPETVKVTGIALDKTEVTINEGETATLTATISPADATTKEITWTSDNETVATVTDGVVSGLSAGSATITATTVDGEFTASCLVTVNKLSKISTIAEIKAILKGGTSSSTKAFDARLTRAVVTYVNGNNAFIEDETAAILYYKSGHGLKVGDVLSGDFAGSGYSYYGVVEITSVTTNPTITAGTAPNPTVATLAQISDNFDAYDSRWVKLENVTTGVALASGTRTSSVSQNGSTLQMYAKVRNTELAAESYGDMLCIPCYNNTTKQIGFWEAAHFTAKNVAVTGVTLDNSTLSIPVGKTATLTATIIPSNATNKNLSWKSSKESVATVENGVVTAVSEGEAKITVTTEDGNYSAFCVVTVTAGGETGGGETGGGEGGTTKYYEKVTSDADIVDGGKYLIVYNGKAANGCTTGVYLTVTGITVENDRIESNTTIDSYAFTINSVEGGYTLKIGDNYIGYNTSTKFSTSTTVPTSTKYYWTFTVQDNNSVLIKNVNKNDRFIGADSSTNVTQFRAYSTKNVNTYPQPTLYKLEN